MKNRKKIGLIVMACMLIGLFGIFFAFQNKTLALFTDSDSALNVIQTGTFDTHIDEEIIDGVKTKVGATNNGTVDAYVRMMVLIPDNQYLTFGVEFYNPNADKTGSKDWVYNEADGYWYYNNILKAKGEAILYKKIQATSKNGVSVTEDLLNKYGDVIVYVEAVQADNITIPDGVECPAIAAFAQLKGSTN